MNSIEKVNRLCKSVLKVTDEDLQAIDKMANEQCDYVNPLKGGTQLKFNKVGNYNKRVLAALVSLRQVLINK